MLWAGAPLRGEPGGGGPAGPLPRASRPNLPTGASASAAGPPRRLESGDSNGREPAAESRTRLDVARCPASPRSSRRLRVRRTLRCRSRASERRRRRGRWGPGSGAPAARQRRIARSEERRAERRVATSPAAESAESVADRPPGRVSRPLAVPLPRGARRGRSRAGHWLFRGPARRLCQRQGWHAGLTARGARRPRPWRSRPGAAATEGRAGPGALPAQQPRLRCCRLGARGG